jgi:hypothetical protein
MAQDEQDQQDLKPVPQRKPGDPVREPPRDRYGRPMVEEIDLNEEEEAALDRAWEHLREQWAKEKKEKEQGK